MIMLLLKGIFLGFSIAAPVGPIGMLCIRNSLVLGRIAGYTTGLGAALADACYGAIAGFGIAIISTFLVGNGFFLNIFGACFLWYLGITTYKTKLDETETDPNSANLFRIFVTTFFLTLTNPMTILVFVGIYAGMGVSLTSNTLVDAASLTIGIFIGSMLWWIFLSLMTTTLGANLDQTKMALINKLSGVILMLFAAFSTYKVISLLSYLYKTSEITLSFIRR